MSVTPDAKVTIDTIIPRRAPVRASTAGLEEIPIIDATPAPSRSMPIWALSIESASLMSGTRDAQVAIDRPLARKIAKIALRHRTYVDRLSVASISLSVSNRFDDEELQDSLLSMGTEPHHHRMNPTAVSDATPRRATLADVAREAGVSPSTASVVFSGKAKVAGDTRERVLAVASALGYAGPDPRAASLRTGRSGIVAVIFQEQLRTAFLDPVKIAMMDGLTDALADLGSAVLLMRDQSAGEQSLALANAPVDAVVLIGHRSNVRERVDAVRARGLPVVVIEGDAGEDVPRIELDNYEATAQLARHVQRLGHERVAVVTLPFGPALERGIANEERIDAMTSRVAIERLAGVREIFADATIVSTAGSFIDEGLLAGRLLLDVPTSWASRSRPTAILAQSDLLAAGVVRAAEELGLRVPEDVSVTGFDGIAVDGLGGHVLTTAVQPAVGKGKAAGEAIARMLRGEPAASIRFSCQFREGTTTGAAPVR